MEFPAGVAKSLADSLQRPPVDLGRIKLRHERVVGLVLEIRLGKGLDSKLDPEVADSRDTPCHISYTSDNQASSSHTMKEVSMQLLSAVCWFRVVLGHVLTLTLLDLHKWQSRLGLPVLGMIWQHTSTHFQCRQEHRFRERGGDG